MRTVNLPGIGLSLKVLFTGYLFVVGFGLAMSGLQILLTHGMADGSFGLSINDIVYSYYGNRGGSLLEAKLQGSMKDKASFEDRATIVKWVQKGSPQKGWDRDIQQIFAANCIKCHGTIPGLADFTTYEKVQTTTHIDEGATISALTRVSHIHLFGIAFIFFFVGLIFSLAVRVSNRAKVLAIGFPFVFLVLDICSWWLTKWYPGFAMLTIVGGIGYFIAAAYMIVGSLYQMWILPLSGAVFDTNSWLDP